MNHKELREGNWVLYESTIDDHSPIQLNHSDLALSEIMHEHYEPIALTEEWFLKLGFIKTSLCDYYIDRFTIYTTGTSLPENERSYHFDNYEIKWVHQLQNLYFSLIGRELQYKA